MENNENNSFLECSLPHTLKQSLDVYKKALVKIQNNEPYKHIDCDYCELQSDINNAEINQEITEEQANYLRNKYLYENE